MADDKNQELTGYDSGSDMWRKYTARCGIITAYCICRRYLETQAKTADMTEGEFCRQLRDEMAAERNFVDVGVYNHSAEYAELDGNKGVFDESDRVNRLCAADIDAVINACEYGDGSVDYKMAVNALTARYGMERLRFVLACEVNWDSVFGRYPDEVYQWACETNIHECYGRFGVRTRPEFLTELITEFRQAEQINNQEQGGMKLTNKLDFYIAFYEQLALKGFQAYAAYDKQNHIADICVGGNNIAHLTKEDNIILNPHAEVEVGTVEKIREIMKETAARFGIFVGERLMFSEKELRIIYVSAIESRIAPNNDWCSDEIESLDGIIAKIEDAIPELTDYPVSADHKAVRDAEFEGVEQ